MWQRNATFEDPDALLSQIITNHRFRIYPLNPSFPETAAQSRRTNEETSGKTREYRPRLVICEGPVPSALQYHLEYVWYQHFAEELSVTHCRASITSFEFIHMKSGWYLNLSSCVILGLWKSYFVLIRPVALQFPLQDASMFHVPFKSTVLPPQDTARASSLKISVLFLALPAVSTLWTSSRQ